MKPDEPTLRPWGQVLEHLRELRGLSKGDVCRKSGMDRPQYRVICYRSKDGPGVDSLNRLLVALGCTWEEWGRTYDAMVQTAAQPVGSILLKEAPTTMWGGGI